MTSTLPLENNFLLGSLQIRETAAPPHSDQNSEVISTQEKTASVGILNDDQMSVRQSSPVPEDLEDLYAKMPKLVPIHSKPEQVKNFEDAPLPGMDLNQNKLESARVGEETQFDEFCDFCSMELVHHSDATPCVTDDGYVKVYETCHVCDAAEPTREHVCRHFMPELLQVVAGFPHPLACTCCDYQVTVLKSVFSSLLMLTDK